MKPSTNINRRTFSKYGIAAMITAASAVSYPSKVQAAPGTLRLGGPVFGKYNSPEEWIQLVQREGYNSAYCPVKADVDDATVRAYEDAAKKANIVIAEVGAWSNPIDADSENRKKAIAYCKTQLHLADRIGAGCCVNISGSVGEKWDGHHPNNLTSDTFDLIVETTRNIIDEVNPTRTYYTLETMPWAYPDSVDSYARLYKAIDRDRNAIHWDPVNIVSSPQLYYNNGAMIKDAFEKLGPYIKSCHAKDIILQQELTVHLDETRPGTGNLDYPVYLKELSKLDNVPLMLEHLSSADEYKQAAAYVRKVAKENNLSFS